MKGLSKWMGEVQRLGKGGWLLGLGLLGVALLASASLFPTPSGAPAPKPGAPAAEGPVGTAGGAGAPDGAYAAQIESALAQTLSEMRGAGEVSVRVFLESGERHEYARKTTGDTRTTQESDRAGTSRVTSEERQETEVTVVRGAGGGSDQPVVVVTHLPEVRGVLVLASGASDPAVRQELTRAVRTALNLPAHRVRVLPKESEG